MSLILVGCSLQEVVLSSIYIVETIRILRTSLQHQTRRLIYQLMCINVIIIIMDLGLLGLECASLYILETITKGVLYSIKLKLEFAILSRLVKFVGGPHRASEQGNRGRSMTFIGAEKSLEEANDNNLSEFVDLTRLATDVTRASLATRREASSPYVDDFEVDIARFQHMENAIFRDGRENDCISGRNDADNQ
jgi:hypothetical protein